MSNIIPIVDDANEINDKTIEHLLNIGFCYVKLPKKNQIKKNLKILESKALDFFRDNQLTKKYLMNSQFEGYADREHSKNAQSIKQFIFRPDKPLGPFLKYKEEIDNITQVFQQHIGLKVIEKIFDYYHLGGHFKNMGSDTFSTFAFLYYPEQLHTHCINALNPHKDFEMITTLWITKPGLQVFFNDTWHEVEPLPNYVVVNLGNVLELMLGKKCKSALHRVKLTSKERLSFGLFVGPGINSPLIEYPTNKIIFHRFSEYLKNQFEQHYEE